ncbi:response regulator [Caulobacter henricii]|uniref:Two-component system response regulator n=1 Tax=Caulobacter henricii TaxID=69395 RepID=A0A0P0NYK5_9CAUL|nr:response regulator [Caulobacter henricii]ALL12755.1 two-component system response regulator [Caulobacter henricii]
MLPSTMINLEKARALIADSSSQAQDILASVLAGFGLRNVVRVQTGREAQDELKARPVDLIFTDAQIKDVDGYELIHWLRRQANDTLRQTPVILVSAHTPMRDVVRARDCGASFIVTKPVSPHVMLERILWVARSDRAFIECDVYVGPDRRWRNTGPPLEHPDGRRRDDQAAEVGEAADQNLSQTELDQLVKPQRTAA